jgi:transcriptional regulator with XRE-family HTH domain
MTFAERLRAAMDGADVNQTQLASRLGIRQSTISQWANEQRTPDDELSSRLARELGASPEWLLEGRGAPPTSTRRRSLARILGLVRWVARAAHPDGGRDGGNANQFTIRASLRALVREAIQNSIDEALGRTVGPVRIRFRLLSLRGEAKSRFLTAMQWDQLRPHVEASVAQAQDQQIAGGLQEALDVADSGELLVLQIADANTRGLIGPENGRGNFAALTRDNLFSEKMSESAGGSYGLGKAMQFAASAFGTVLFLSDTSEPEEATGNSRGRFFARSELVYHEHEDGEKCAGPLWLGLEPEERKPISYWADGTGDALIRDLQMTREETTSGTTIAVVGLRDLDADTPRPPRAIVEQIAADVERDFWPALENGDLEVRVEYIEIDDPDAPATPEIDVQVTPGSSPDIAPLVAAYRAYRAGEIVESLIDDGDVVAVSAALNVPARRTGQGTHTAFTHDAVVLVRRATADETIEPGAARTLRQAVLFRGSNMIVKTLDLGRSALGAHPFQVVVLGGLAAGAGDDARRAEEFLRAAEPPSHDDWTYTRRVRQRYVQGGKKALTNFEATIRREVHRVLAVEVDEQPDGPRDLARRFRFGEPPNPERAPAVAVTSWVVNGDGAWEVEGAVRLRGDLRRNVSGKLQLRFLGETGGTSRVKWHELTAVGPGAAVADDGETLVIAAQRRSARFRGVTDPDSHPAPAVESTATVVFHPVRQEA